MIEREVYSYLHFTFKFKFKFIYSHLFNYNTTIREKKEEGRNRAKYILN